MLCWRLSLCDCCWNITETIPCVVHLPSCVFVQVKMVVWICFSWFIHGFNNTRNIHLTVFLNYLFFVTAVISCHITIRRSSKTLRWSPVQNFSGLNRMVNVKTLTNLETVCLKFCIQGALKTIADYYCFEMCAFCSIGKQELIR